MPSRISTIAPSQLDGGALVVKAATSDFTAAIAPVITDFRILMGVRIKVKDDKAGTFNIHACGKIAIAIANPYSVPAEMDQRHRDRDPQPVTLRHHPLPHPWQH